ncbi:MAG: alanine--tRNA ligase-related protein [Haloferacaceae archaeon]
MTETLYLTETDRQEFEATVERVLDDRVVLDRTCFYPTGGGQPNDTGTLRNDDGEWRVSDVRKKDTIYHAVEPAAGTDAAAPGEGETVTGVVDWDRREAHMRYHTAQHLLSALLLEEYDARTTGNQLYDDHAHLDCAYERFTAEDLGDVEARLNELVDDARPVRWYSMDRDEAEATLDTDRTRIHLLPDSITEVRIVEIGGDDGDPYDRTACAGTHVSDTAAIGTVTVTGRETKGSDEERVHFELE